MIDDQNALIDSLKNQTEAAQYLMTVIENATPDDLLLAVKNVHLAEVATKTSSAIIDEFIEILTPQGVYEAYLETGELRLVDWQSVYEMAGYIGFHVSHNVKALNDELAQQQVPHPNPGINQSNPNGSLWARIELSPIESKMTAYKLIEEEMPERGYWRLFKSQMAHCLEVSLSLE